LFPDRRHEGIESDNDSSLDIDESKFPRQEIRKIGKSFWEKRSNNQRDSWDIHAVEINWIDFRMCERYPNGINDRIVCHSISIKWRSIMNFLHASLKNRCRRRFRNKKYRLEMERIVIENQVYKRIFVSPIIRTIIFGDNFSLLSKFEKFYPTKTSTIIHVKECMRYLS